MLSDDLKPDFARELLKHGDPNKAAFAITDDPGSALQIAYLWAKDPVVLACTAKLLESPTTARELLATKERQARDVYALAMNERVDVKERLAAHRLFAELMGHIEKQAGNAINILNQGVMVVRDHGSDNEWEAKAIAQQRNLIIDATASN